MKHLIIVGAIVLFNLPSIAAAREGEAIEARAASKVTPVDPTEIAKLSPFGASPIDDAKLQTIAGREDTTQVSQAQQNASVTRNSVGEYSVTGDAEISGNAFQNMSGLSIVNVNTGNNVAINASMNVNISMSPSP